MFQEKRNHEKKKTLLFVLCWLCSTMLSWADGDVSITLSGDNRAATLRNGIVSI